MSDIIQKKLIYDNLLKKQMCEAYEIEYFKYKISDRELKKWLKTRQEQGIQYLDFIDYMHSYPQFSEYNSIEIGKGPKDSIFKDKEFTVATEHCFDFNQEQQIVLPGILKITEYGEPYLQSQSGKGMFKFDMDTRFITQNPYFNSELLGWQKLHNNGTSNITVGVYGSKYDSDKRQKIKLIENLKKKLNNEEYSEEYDTTKNNYYYAISTNRKSLTKVKTRKKSKY